MSIGLSYATVNVTFVLDCSETPKKVNIVRLMIAKNGESTAWARVFKSFDDVRAELMGINLLSSADLNDLHQNFGNGLSWRGPNLIPVTPEQLIELKLRRVECSALASA